MHALLIFTEKNMLYLCLDYEKRSMRRFLLQLIYHWELNCVIFEILY